MKPRRDIHCMPEILDGLIGPGYHNRIKSKDESSQCSYNGIAQQFVFVHSKFVWKRKIRKEVRRNRVTAKEAGEISLFALFLRFCHLISLPAFSRSSGVSISTPI